MGILFALIFGLVIWVVGWALDLKSFDVFLLTLLIVLIAAGARIVSPYLPGNRGDDSPGGRWTPR